MVPLYPLAFTAPTPKAIQFHFDQSLYVDEGKRVSNLAGEMWTVFLYKGNVLVEESLSAVDQCKIVKWPHSRSNATLLIQDSLP